MPTLKAQSPPDELLRVKDIIAPDGLLKISRSTLYSWIQTKRLPPPIRLGARVSVWRRSELLAAVERLAAENQ